MTSPTAVRRTLHGLVAPGDDDAIVLAEDS